MSKTQLNLIQLFYLLTSLLSILYVIFRAFTVGATYDEVWTLERFIPLNFLEILNYSPPEANNHILNTLLVKLFYFLDIKSLFLARLPSLLAFGLYAFYAYKLCYTYLSKYTGFGCFLLLLLNPFVLDFFGLSRGYGLALGFQMTSIYFAIKYFHSSNLKYAVITLVCGALSVLGNFTFLNFYLTLLIVLILITLYLKEKINLNKFALYSLLITTFLGLIIYEPIRKLRLGGNFYYGGDSFYSDTLVSITKYSMYESTADSLTFVVLNSFILIFLSVLIFSFFKDLKFSIKNIFVLLLIGCILSLVLQNVFFNTLYLIDRTALLFYPLIIFTLVFALNSLKKALYSKVIMLFFVLVFGLNFFSNANLYKTATWYFDAHTREILTNLNNIGEKKGKVLNIDFSWPFQKSVAYYMKKDDYPFLKVVKSKENREIVSENTDYYIYLNHPLEKVGYNADNVIIYSWDKQIWNTYPKEYIFVYSSNETGSQNR